MDPTVDASTQSDPEVELAAPARSPKPASVSGARADHLRELVSISEDIRHGSWRSRRRSSLRLIVPVMLVYGMVMVAIMLPRDSALSEGALLVGRYAAVGLLVAMTVGWARRYVKTGTDAFTDMEVGSAWAMVARVGAGLAMVLFVLIGVAPFAEWPRSVRLAVAIPGSVGMLVPWAVLLVGLVKTLRPVPEAEASAAATMHLPSPAPTAAAVPPPLATDPTNSQDAAPQEPQTGHG